MSHSLNFTYANYWKTSLLDADSGKGAFKDEKSLSPDFKRCTLDELKSGQIHEELLIALFLGESEHAQTVSVILRPKVYVAQFFHGKAPLDGTPGVVAPIIVNTNIARDGRLYPNHIFIARDLLEPLDRGSFSVGNIAELDTFLTKNHFADFYDQYKESETTGETKEEWFESRWQEFTDHYQKLCTEVIGEGLLTPQFNLAKYFFIIKEDVISPSKHIKELYGNIINNKPEAPLFCKYTSEAKSPTEPCISQNSMFSQRLAHSGDKFHLAQAQRDALNHVLSSEEGEILAVNGPPGTGKSPFYFSGFNQ